MSKMSRKKKTRKVLEFYSRMYGLKPPFSIIVDGDYLQAALEGKIRLAEQLPSLMQGPAHASTTQCVLDSLKSKGKHYNGAAMIGASLKKHSCAHEGDVTPRQCLLALIANGNCDRLCVAAQHPKLREKVRKIPGTPLLFISGQTPLLEPPSENTKTDVSLSASSRMGATSEEIKLAKSVIPKRQKRKFFKKVAKEPNPLASRKKKKKPPTPAATPPKTAKAAAFPLQPSQSAQAADAKPKRKRNRKRKRSSAKKAKKATE